MNIPEKESDNLLRQYLNKEMVEKAPEGFVSKVMAQVQLEVSPEEGKRFSWEKSLVPLISVVITIVLVIAALLSPASINDSTTFPLANLIKNIKITLPEINLTSVFSFDIPVTIVYVFMGILILTLLDRVLYGIFRKENHLNRK